jgi:hypothetical protein
MTHMTNTARPARITAEELAVLEDAAAAASDAWIKADPFNRQAEAVAAETAALVAAMARRAFTAARRA